ncbi:MAG TPA: hypothetical protein VL285_18925 [Bryobacteraceae bacterium]|nr:hypothetical protein [Bryobacteraceae bacterium]
MPALVLLGALALLTLLFRLLHLLLTALVLRGAAALLTLLFGLPCAFLLLHLLLLLNLLLPALLPLLLLLGLRRRLLLLTPGLRGLLSGLRRASLESALAFLSTVPVASPLLLFILVRLALREHRNRGSEKQKTGGNASQP